MALFRSWYLLEHLCFVFLMKIFLIPMIARWTLITILLFPYSHLSLYQVLDDHPTRHLLRNFDFEIYRSLTSPYCSLLSFFYFYFLFSKSLYCFYSLPFPLLVLYHFHENVKHHSRHLSSIYNQEFASFD